MTPPQEKDSKKYIAKVGAYAGLGLGLLTTILLFTYGGWWADQHYAHSLPWVTAVTSLIGVGIGLFAVFKQIQH